MFALADPNSFVGDLVAVDTNLDYRVDVLYAGTAIYEPNPVQPIWCGKLYRISTAGGSADTEAWGVDGVRDRVPS